MPEVMTTVEAKPWGTTRKGEPVELYVLTSEILRVGIATFGATIVSIEAPDRDGKRADVALGFNSVEGYDQDDTPYFGATIGRYANRIAGGTFVLDGVRVQTPVNNGPNGLHGGTVGFDKRVWAAEIVPGGVEMRLVAADGEMGYPGELHVTVKFTLDGGTLRIEYTATTSKTTVVNLTNHSYFNLAGESSGTVLGQTIRIAADRITPVTDVLIPAGELAPVAGTAFALRETTAIGARIDDAEAQLTFARGYDHNFVIGDAPSNDLRFVAEATDPVSGRVLTVMSTEPGVQFYSGNFLDGSLANKTGGTYVFRSGFCLETQHFPDSPNQPQFPSTRLRPGEVFRSKTSFAFSVDR